MQGLLPYDMFATKLLSSPARLLALEPEQKVGYRLFPRNPTRQHYQLWHCAIFNIFLTREHVFLVALPCHGIPSYPCVLSLQMYFLWL
jgi:hypothetical protein